jgi:hypothetical protein
MRPCFPSKACRQGRGVSSVDLDLVIGCRRQGTLHNLYMMQGAGVVTHFQVANLIANRSLHRVDLATADCTVQRLVPCRIVNGTLNYQFYARPSYEIIGLLLEGPSDREYGDVCHTFDASSAGLLACFGTASPHFACHVPRGIRALPYMSCLQLI